MDLASMSHATLIHCLVAMCDHIDDGSSWEKNGAYTCISTIPHSSMNGPILETAAVSAPAIREAIEKARATGYPVSVLAPGDLTASQRAVLAEYGYTVEEEIPVMTASRPVDSPWPDELELLDGPAAEAAHVDMVADVFSMDRSWIETMINPDMYEFDDSYAVVGTLDGEPVTTGFALRRGSGAGVFNIATTDGHRGKGYGAAATAAVTNHWFDRGITHATLQSSDMGRSVYRRIGFRDVMTHRRWSEPEVSEG